jgi:short-subunit dehydrogenase
MENATTVKNYVLITGGTSGIGYELARCFAAQGYPLILVARSEEGLAEVAGELLQQYGVLVHRMAKDLMVPGAARELYEEIALRDLTVDILVNNAGQGHYGLFTETDLDREVDLIHLNVLSLVSLTKYFLKEMKERGRGRILQVASSLAKAPSPYMAVYAASKAFVLSFTEALIQEVKDSGVTLTALLPGATDTDFFHKAGAENTKEYRETSLYDPAEVAHAAYEGLMSGSSQVVPGTKNKLQGMMGATLPDKLVAANMKNHLSPSEKEEGRSEITHDASARERDRIERQTGKPDGDMNRHQGHDHRE